VGGNDAAMRKMVIGLASEMYYFFREAEKEGALKYERYENGLAAFILPVWRTDWFIIPR
jgi:hypothetical protein